MKLFKKHFEWLAFAGALILMASIDPYSYKTSWCLFDLVGIEFCPGEGLGHSIAFLFRGEFTSSLNANLMGPFAVVILTGRILSIWNSFFKNYNLDFLENKNG